MMVNAELSWVFLEYDLRIGTVTGSHRFWFACDVYSFNEFYGDSVPSYRLFHRHQQLQLMPIRIVEIDAMGIVGATAHLDAGAFQRRFDAGVVARRQTQCHVIHFAAAMDVFVVFDFKQGDALVAAFQKTLPVSFALDFHAEEVDIEITRAREIFHVQYDVVEAADF